MKVVRLLCLACAVLAPFTSACTSSAPPIIAVPTAPATATATAPAPVEQPKPTCLVLSVGGAAGIAHVGAIESIRAHGVEVSCVVGNSMGSLIGALYASHPQRDGTADFRALLDEYVADTKADAGQRAVVGSLVGLAALGPLGIFLGGGAGLVTVDRLLHQRLVSVLDRHLQGAHIETLPIPYATSYEPAPI